MVSRQHLEGGRFASTVDTQQTKALALGDSETQAVHGQVVIAVSLGQVSAGRTSLWCVMRESGSRAMKMSTVLVIFKRGWMYHIHYYVCFV